MFADHLPWLPNPVPFPHSWYRSCAVSVGYGVHWLRLDCSQVCSVSLMVGSCTIPFSCYNLGSDLGSLRTRIMGCFWLDPAYFWWCEWLLFNPGESWVQPCSLPELNCRVSQPGLFFGDPFTPWPGNNPGRAGCVKAILIAVWTARLINLQMAMFVGCLLAWLQTLVLNVCLVASLVPFNLGTRQNKDREEGCSGHH